METDSLTANVTQRNCEAVEHLLQESCYVIDLLPSRVSIERSEAFSQTERFFLGSDRISLLHQKFIAVLLKLNCYVPFQGSSDNGDTWYEDPSPEQLISWFGETGFHILILLDGTESLITADDQFTYMALFHPGDSLLKLVQQIACSEGLFVWESN